jgi:hypothetical protein
VHACHDPTATTGVAARVHSRPLRQECHDFSLVSAILVTDLTPSSLFKCANGKCLQKEYCHLAASTPRRENAKETQRVGGRRECGRREATLRASSSSLRSRSEIIFVSFTDSIFRNLASRCACIPCMSPQAYSMYVTIDHNYFIYVTIYHMPSKRVLPHVAEDMSRTAHVAQMMYHPPSGTPCSTRQCSTRLEHLDRIVTTPL